MFDVNEYFDGKVKSLAFTHNSDNATVGVMAAGDYEFGTHSIEHMTLISGKMSVKLPDESEWRDIAVNETFIVAANTSFLVKIGCDSAYLCVYK
ncbi:MAG TPA: pyrimidine/purine nucleoside phosphorylase [Gammaproteobacteria bacterium]|nr:pyrimidine/purine nucleoside phosphorylase [Gammaproteobacteria bacterium]